MGAAESGVGDGAAGAGAGVGDGSWAVDELPSTPSEEEGFVLGFPDASPLGAASSVASVGDVGRSVLGVWEVLLDCSEMLSEFNEGGDDMLMIDEW